MVEEIGNAYAQVQDRYPRTVTEAYKIPTHWNQNPRNMVQIVRSQHIITEEEVAFLNVYEK